MKGMMGMIGVIDYGAGNLQSVANALDRIGAPHRPVTGPAELGDCQRILLPGVGHFAPAADRLHASGLAAAIVERARAGTPVLGICLGMQLLLDGSDEAPDARGLGLIPGRNVALDPAVVATVPHMGWNAVRWSRDAGPLAGSDLNNGDHFYFAHSYIAAPEQAEDILATVDLGTTSSVVVAVSSGRVAGVQFHPEKSSTAGLGLLERFARC